MCARVCCGYFFVNLDYKILFDRNHKVIYVEGLLGEQKCSKFKIQNLQNTPLNLKIKTFLSRVTKQYIRMVRFNQPGLKIIRYHNCVYRLMGGGKGGRPPPSPPGKINSARRETMHLLALYFPATPLIHSKWRLLIIIQILVSHVLHSIPSCSCFYINLQISL